MKVKQSISAGVMSLGLVVGLAGFAGATSGTIEKTGPDSVNVVKERTSQRVRVHNNNHVNVENRNHQSAWSGDAEVEHNTTGGSARSGNASNANALNGSVTVDNTASSAARMTSSNLGSNNSARITNTGPDSYNKVKITNTSNVTVENNNHIDVTNTNDQHASSGDAEVSGNTTGGSATSGNATNTNSTTLNFRVSN